MDERTGRGPTVTRVLAAAVLAAAGGCKGKSANGPSPSPSTGDNDRLLALAPAGTRAAVVVSGRALELIEAARSRAQAIARTDELVRGALAEAERELADALGVPADATLAQLGLGGQRGFALFQLPDEQTITIWPVADRAAFLTAFHGQAGADRTDTVVIAGQELRCREVRDVYACAPDVALFGRLGTGSLEGKPAGAGARGDVEVVASTEDGGGTPMTTLVTAALDPGQLVVHARIDTKLDDETRAMVSDHVRVDAGRASGFLGVAVARALLPSAGDDPLTAAAATMRGRITAVTPSGVADVDVRVPLVSTAAVRALLGQCDRLPLPPTMTAAVDGERCVVSSSQPPAFAATAWIDGDSLRINRTGGAPAAPTGPAPTAAGRELAAGAWTMVAWGRGTTLSMTDAARPAAGGQAAGFMRAILYLTELGFGLRIDERGMALTLVVRTLLANPAPVAEALPPLVARAAAGEDVAKEVAALAAAHPGSPFADDIAAGPVGLMVPSMAMGMLAAVAIPKFLDYMKKGKRSEAELNLNAIAKAADAERAESASFPVATAPLTPAQACCAGPGRRCAPVRSEWEGVDAWDALGFEMTEPHFFQYSYTSDGQTVLAEAVGDLDCDGVTVTYQLRGAVDATGATTWELLKPQRAD